LKGNEGDCIPLAPVFCGIFINREMYLMPLDLRNLTEMR